MAFDIDAEFSKLLTPLGVDPRDTGGKVTFAGEDPILPSRHRLGAIVAMAMMAPAVATQVLHRMRGGTAQDLSVDLRKAVCHTHPFVAFHPTVGGYPYQMLFADPRVNPMLFGMFPTKDGRWYLPTAAYPHMVPDWLGLLGCSLNERSVTEAIAKWNAQELEDAAADRGMIGSICRTPEEWLAHEQGSLLARTPMIEIVRIGDSSPEMPRVLAADRPLSGVRVASFTHVIAGQVVGRTLAEQGAEILHLTRPEFEYDVGWIDTTPGFRSAWMDLTKRDYAAKGREILRGADVLVENYRGRKLADLGFSAEEVAAVRPGIIYASIRAFGWEGPWAQRGGFDMDANCCTGYTVLEGTSDKPELPPTKILNDYVAGYLTAFGVLAALKMRAEHGGSYHVRASLSRYSMWYSQLGLFDREEVARRLADPAHKLIPPTGVTLDTAFGDVTRLEPGITFSKTPGRWEIPGEKVIVPRGSSTLAWLGA
ncbi:MAG: carnitine dehydratase [Planctomycetia bacterium]|nr:carnitine dehydratase [Planctomycetia bacterium]